MYIIYHQVKPGTDCPDGICAAWVVNKALASVSELEFVGVCHLNNDEYLAEDFQLPFDPSGKDVILVDFSYPQIILERICGLAQSLTILDHHKPRANDIAALSDRILGGYSANDCGATFAWNFFFPNKPAPWFLKHVWRRDTGAFGYYEGEAPESEAIGAAMSARRKGLVGVAAFPVFDALLSETEEMLIAEGAPEIEERDRLVAAELRRYDGAVLQVGPYVVPHYRIKNQECDRHYSIVGNVAAKLRKNAEFVAVSVSNDSETIHLRGAKRCSVDLGELAKSLGGGGHYRAAGYKRKTVHP